MNVFGTTGQERTAWLNELLGASGNALDYYLGPTGLPDKLRGLGQLASFTDAGDMVEAGDASRALWNDPSVANFGRYATAGAALALPVVSARGLNVLGDATASGLDDISEFMRRDDGAFGGIRALTADRGALEQAQAMTEAGVYRDDVWRDTGWFKGVDGQWRFEIDDSKSGLTERVWDAYADPQMKAGVPWVPRIETDISGAYTHPELYRAYAEDAPFGGSATLSKAMTPEGSYDMNTDAIRSIAPDADTHRSVFLHELQHGVQKREGFATGGNPEQFYPEELINQVNDLDHLEDSLLGQSWRAKDPAEKADLLRRSREAGEQKRALRKQTGEWRYNQYRSLAGEVESRNVQTRRDFNADQRRATPPWATQDVPDDQQIIRGILQKYGI